MSFSLVKKDYDQYQVVFAQAQSDNKGGLYPYYPARVENTELEFVRCRWFDPENLFAGDKEVEVVQKVSRDRIMEFNLENKKYIESTQMDTQDPKTREYWHKCVAEAAGCVNVAENWKKKKKQTRFQFVQKLQSNQSPQEQNENGNKVK